MSAELLLMLFMAFSWNGMLIKVRLQTFQIAFLRNGSESKHTGK
jgi:hypothetical protein